MCLHQFKLLSRFRRKMRPWSFDVNTADGNIDRHAVFGPCQAL